MHCRKAIIHLVVTLCLAFAGCGEAFSQTATTTIDNIGEGFYGIQSPRWPCSNSLTAFNGVRGIRVSFLYNTFGTETACLKRYFSDPRMRAVQIHLTNGPGRRNRRLGSYEFAAGLSVQQFQSKLRNRDAAFLADFVRYAQPIAKLVEPHVAKGLHCYVSAELESNLPPAEFQTLTEAIAPLFPGCMFVYNPAGINSAKRPIDGYIYEEHGLTWKIPKGFHTIANLDGVDIAFHGLAAVLPQRVSVDDLPEYARRYVTAIINSLWTAHMNGICGGAFIDPRKRTCWPSLVEFQKLNAIHLEIEAAPLVVPEWSAEDDKSKAGCKTYPKFGAGPSGAVWKQSDTRPGAVFVAGVGYSKDAAGRLIKFNRVDIVKAGKVFTSLNWSGWENGDRQHWRSEWPAIPAKQFPFNVVLKADSYCWVIKNPKVRNS